MNKTTSLLGLAALSGVFLLSPASAGEAGCEAGSLQRIAWADAATPSRLPIVAAAAPAAEAPSTELLIYMSLHQQTVSHGPRALLPMTELMPRAN